MLNYTESTTWIHLGFVFLIFFAGILGANPSLHKYLHVLQFVAVVFQLMWEHILGFLLITIESPYEYRTKLGMTKVVLRGSWDYHHCKPDRGPP